MYMLLPVGIVMHNRLNVFSKAYRYDSYESSIPQRPPIKSGPEVQVQKLNIEKPAGK